MNPACLTQLGPFLGIISVFLIGYVVCEDIETHVVLLGGNLTCHSCYKNEHGDACVNFHPSESLAIEHCTAAQQYCQVYMQKTDNDLVLFERGCASECTPGCVTIGHLLTVERCYICCDENDCNYENLPNAGKTSQFVVGLVSAFLPILLCLWFS